MYLLSVKCKKQKFLYKNCDVMMGYFVFIANASNSIIGMWALKPSILELLAVKLLPYDRGLTQHSPVLQYSVLYLLYSHCSR
jgi:PI-3-kinase-related kinase SMG-1